MDLENPIIKNKSPFFKRRNILHKNPNQQIYEMQQINQKYHSEELAVISESPYMDLQRQSPNSKKNAFTILREELYRQAKTRIKGIYLFILLLMGLWIFIRIYALKGNHH